MEIKIKDKDNLIDATIEVVDGVMIVSPKEEKYEPKDGDVVFSGISLISIFKEMSSNTSFASYASLYNGKLKIEFDFWSASNIRPATAEEKQKLFDKLKEEGYKFDFEKKELVKLRWKPELTDIYYNPCYAPNIGFKCKELQWNNDAYDNSCYNIGWVYRTKEECEQFCSRLNKAIENIKP